MSQNATLLSTPSNDRGMASLSKSDASISTYVCYVSFQHRTNVAPCHSIQDMKAELTSDVNAAEPCSFQALIRHFISDNLNDDKKKEFVALQDRVVAQENIIANCNSKRVRCIDYSTPTTGD